MKRIFELWRIWIAKLKGDCLKDEIRHLAYMKAKERNFEPGHDWDDWLAAEKEVVERHYNNYCGTLSID